MKRSKSSHFRMRSDSSGWVSSLPAWCLPNSRLRSPAAWGDFAAAILALLSIAALTWRWSFAIPLVWIFNLWGTIDLLYAYYNGIMLEIEPGLFGAAFYIPTMIVPPLLVIHALIFLILLRKEKGSGRGY
jgi:hypothetical protein